MVHVTPGEAFAPTASCTSDGYHIQFDSRTSVALTERNARILWERLAVALFADAPRVPVPHQIADLASDMSGSFAVSSVDPLAEHTAEAIDRVMTTFPSLQGLA